MKQVTFSVALEVRPESAARVASLIEDLKDREDHPSGGTVDNFARLREGIPCLHFMSISVFTNSSYDPTLILEANFDGEPRDFWKQTDALMGEALREIIRCCKAPLDEDGPLYHKVTAEGSTVPATRYLEARAGAPSVFHHGNRGLARDRILNDASLFRALRAELDNPDNQGPTPYRNASLQQVHRRLREAMLPDHPWLDDPAPPRVPVTQRIGDIIRLLLFVTFVIAVFSAPGILIAAWLDPQIFVTLVIVLFVMLAFGIVRKFDPLPGTEVTTGFSLARFFLRNLPLIVLIVVPPLVILIILALCIVGLLAGLGLAEGGFDDWKWPVVRTVLLGQLGMLFTVPATILWLRYLERRDTSQDAPPVDADMVAQMARREDWISQNHMGSIVNIRPGVLRTLIVRTGHRGLGLLLRVKATRGYLGSMRTVHFAHWAFLNNNSQLLFVSNFDQSWGSYLDDFIEKAHVGLTLAWGCGVGFPPTRYLIFDGASHGRRFKNWALASRSVSRFWYSAYPGLSVDQVERNHRVATGLRKREMTPGDIRTWMRDL